MIIIKLGNIIGKNKDDSTPPTENLLMRLAFHDCIPYITEEGAIEGGCDGCLNMDQDLKGNMGLQYTIATLEKLYQE